jgi:hypothetical protein
MPYRSGLGQLAGTLYEDIGLVGIGEVERRQNMPPLIAHDGETPHGLPYSLPTLLIIHRFRRVDRLRSTILRVRDHYSDFTFN